MNDIISARRIRHRRFHMSDRAMTYALVAARTDPTLYQVLRDQANGADWYSDDGRLLADELDKLSETMRP